MPVIIEASFVSEKLWAEVLGRSTEGLSYRWPKMGPGKEEIDEWIQARAKKDRVPWRLPTSAEWDEDFNEAPFAHSLYGWTSSRGPTGLYIFRGGSAANFGVPQAKILYDIYAGYASQYQLGLRCARDFRREIV